MFSITPAASAELLAAAERSDAVGMALRIAARPLADGSIEYGMGFDDERENDESTEHHGLTVLLGARSRPHLAATTLDYVEIEPGRFDFVFVPGDGPATDGGPAAAPATPAEPTDPAASAEPGCGSGGCSRCGG